MLPTYGRGCVDFNFRLDFPTWLHYSNKSLPNLENILHRQDGYNGGEFYRKIYRRPPLVLSALELPRRLFGLDGPGNPSGR